MSKFENTVKNIDLVKEMLNDKRPLFEIARKLGIKYDTLIVHLKKLGIKYEKNQSRKGIRHKEVRKDSYHYLGTDKYIQAPVLKKKLIEDGIKEYKCEKCGITEWEGKPAPLELHHINGNHYDNRLENLIILCSNCHAIEHEYCNGLHKELYDVKTETNNTVKKEKKVKEQTCQFCGKTFKSANKQKFCSLECAGKSFRKNNIEITKELLISLFKENGSFVQTGKKLNMSDKGVIKWFKKFGLPTHANELKEYVDNL